MIINYHNKIYLIWIKLFLEIVIGTFVGGLSIMIILGSIAYLRILIVS